MATIVPHLQPPDFQSEIDSDSPRRFSLAWLRWFAILLRTINALLDAFEAEQVIIDGLTPTGYVVAVKYTAGFSSQFVDGSAGTGGTTHTYTVPGLLTTDVIGCVSLLEAAQSVGVAIGNARVSAVDTLEIAWICAAPAGSLIAAGAYSIVVFRTSA